MIYQVPTVSGNGLFAPCFRWNPLFSLCSELFSPLCSRCFIEQYSERMDVFPGLSSVNFRIPWWVWPAFILMGWLPNGGSVISLITSPLVGWLVLVESTFSSSSLPRLITCGFIWWAVIRGCHYFVLFLVPDQISGHPLSWCVCPVHKFPFLIWRCWGPSPERTISPEIFRNPFQDVLPWNCCCPLFPEWTD